MLEAYLKNQHLREIEASLPEDLAQAQAKLNTVIEEQPQNKRALLMLARCQLLAEKSLDAKRTLEGLLEIHPDYVSAKVQLAKVGAGDEDYEQAISLLSAATEARPELVENWLLLSDYLRRDGQSKASQDAMQQYEMIKAFNGRLQNAERAFEAGDLKAADTQCRQLLQLVPTEVRTFKLMARIARRLGHYEFSTATLARCVATRPGDAGLRLEYGYSLLASRKYPEALAECQSLAELAPELIAGYDLQAEVLYMLGRYTEAIAIYRNLLVLPENRTTRLLHLGKALKTLGDVAAATACYREAIEAEPGLGQAYWELANLKTYQFSDDEIQSMQQLLATGQIGVLDKIMVEFALGKALEDAGQFTESFSHYDSANRAYAKSRSSLYVSQTDRLKSLFTAEFFSARQEYGLDTDAPVFVVGLPRSGSTLLEQILSSHSLVDATRELDEIVSIARSLNDPQQPAHGQYPQALAKLTRNQVRDYAQQYLDHAAHYRQQAPYFVDKAPHNFHHIGLIKTLFPNARIVDIRRNPLASGWSLYRQFFADSYLFSYDLETIGHYYNDYIALMDHWHTVLPGQILTINYEDLVDEFRTTIDTLLGYCSLELEDACLDFHLNKRAIATPSSEQVRQPLYRDALEHWKHYDKFLSPLKAVLAANRPAPAPGKN